MLKQTFLLLFLCPFVFCFGYPVYDIAQNFTGCTLTSIQQPANPYILQPGKFRQQDRAFEIEFPAGFAYVSNDSHWSMLTDKQNRILWKSGVLRFPFSQMIERGGDETDEPDKAYTDKPVGSSENGPRWIDLRLMLLPWLMKGVIAYSPTKARIVTSLKKLPAKRLHYRIRLMY
jgi:hypothetical protein